MALPFKTRRSFGPSRFDQQAEFARRAALARAYKKHQTSRARLEAADRALKKGNIAFAADMYRRVARSRPKSKITRLALGRIRKLQYDGNKQLQEVAVKLARIRVSSDPGKDGKPWQQNVRDQFAQLKDLRNKYKNVPLLGSKIKNSIARLSNQSLYKEAILEPDAAKLLARAKQLEKEDKVCCAYYVYEETAKLTPAPSAVAAKRRWEVLTKNKLVVQGAKACKDLQWCHTAFRRAELLTKVNRSKAIDLYGQIVRRSSMDSRIHMDARRRAMQLAQK